MMGMILVAAFLTGCGEGKPAASRPSPEPKHEHKPPHGGTPVVLGDEEYHIELVLDASAATIQAYIMDGELENFVRVTAESFEIPILLARHKAVLHFKAVPNQATGETVGDTALFEARSDWLKFATNFDGVLSELTVRGTKYQNISFNFPNGNDHNETKK
ncbi:MAG: hypothetical protein JWR69_4477 [Pedosphaera sp.]|nr:hypothetical protein [Pedosphaera sp.]